MINNRPFIHVLKTPYSYYVYDVNTDRVVRISDEMYNYFLDIEHGIESKMSHELSVEMNELSISGYLKTFHPKEIQDPREFQLEYLLNNRIEGLTLQITQKCNMRCSYCSFTCGDNIHGRSHSSNSMSYETAISAIDFYYQHSMDSKLINIAFYGGEPLLEFEKIKRIIEYVKIKFEGKDISFNITTNAILLTPEKLRFFDTNNVNIMVSLDGPESVQNKSRKLAGNGDGSYALIEKQLRRLKLECPEEYSKLSFNSVIDPLYDITPIVEFYKNDIFYDSTKEFRVSDEKGDFSINTPVMDTPAGTSSDASEEFYLSERVSELLAYYYLIGIAENNVMNPIAFNIVASLVNESRNLNPTDSLSECSAKGGPCVPGVHNTFVRIDGELFPCEKASDISEALNIGSIHRGYDVENIRKMLNIGKMTEKKCINCWAIRHCSSCVIHANKINGLSKEMLLAKCPQIKSQFEASLLELIALDEIRSILLECKVGGLKDGKRE